MWSRHIRPRVCAPLGICILCLTDLTGQTRVSYGTQIAPLLALRCTACHSVSNPSSNFRVTTYTTLLAGGNIGEDVVPGKPDFSALIEFLEGRRGPRQQMPQGSPPLSASELELIRRWISQGAQNDNREMPCFELRIQEVPLSSSAALEIAARVASPGFITLTVRSLGPARDLHVEEGSINAPRDSANIAAPGEWISWRLSREQGWPSLASLVLRIQYASETPDGSVLTARTGGSREQRTAKLWPMSCLPL